MARQNTAAQAADDDTDPAHKVVDLMANLQRSLEKATPLPPESATEILRNVLQVLELSRELDAHGIKAVAGRIDQALRILEAEGAL